MSEYGFVFDEKKCTSCHGCTVACKSWREIETGLNQANQSFVTMLLRRIEKRWRGSYPVARVESFSVSCQHCIDPPCIPVCPVNAISKDKATGIVHVNEAQCVGCRKCSPVCPFDAPQFSFKAKEPKMQLCDMCHGIVDLNSEEPPCIATCNTKAITLKIMSAEEKMVNQRQLHEKLVTISE